VLTVLGGSAFLLLLLQPAPWWGRLTLWLLALGLPAIAAAAQLGWDSGRTGLRALTLGALGLLLVTGVWEATVAYQSANSMGRRESSRDYQSTLEYYFGAMVHDPAFAPVLEAKRLARSRWSRIGTLLGGALALPLGEREIILLSDHPSPAELVSLRDAGVSWVLWDRSAAGPPPPELLQRTGTPIRYHPGEDFELDALPLAFPGRP